MPHVNEREGQEDDVRKPEKTDAPDRQPSGELGGHAINAHETAPRKTVPDAAEGGNAQPRHPEAVDDEPGSDL